MGLKLKFDTLTKVIAAAGGIGLAVGFAPKVFSKSKSKSTGTDPMETEDAGQRRYNDPRWSWDFNWDKRDPAVRLFAARRSLDGNSRRQPSKEQLLADLEQATPKAARNIFLIRHGQYNQVPQHDSERKLTDLGRKQAAATGKRLKFLVNESDRYIVSNMTRALETADLIRTQLNLKSNPFECDPLLAEGSPIEPDPRNRWHPDVHYYDDGMRIEAAFRKYFHRAEPEQEKESFEVIVCHGNVIRYFCCRALQFPPERWLRMSLAHGSITHVRVDPGGEVNILSIGDSSHLPSDEVTTS